MTATWTTHRRGSRRLAAVLLVVQALAGGVVPLAHAGERDTAASAVEAHHDASCVVIHDAMRCALCMYATSLGAPEPTGGPAFGTSRYLCPALLRSAVRSGGGAHTASQPRAPPIHRS